MGTFTSYIKSHSVLTSMVGVILILEIMSIAVIFMTPQAPNDGKNHISWVTNDDPNKQLVAEMFNQSSANTVIAIDPDSGGVAKTMIQSAAGIGGDVLDFVHEFNIQTYQSAGILMDLTDKAPQYGFPLELVADSVKGLCVVGVPCTDGKLRQRQFTFPATVDNHFIIYNKAIFDKYGVPYPGDDMTWEEYILMAQKLTRYAAPGDAVPEVFGATGARLNFITILWGKGGDMFNESCTASTLDTPEAFEALKFYRDLHFKYKAEPTATLRAGATPSGGTGAVASSSDQALFGSGKVAMIWAGRWFLKDLRVYADYNKKMIQNWEKRHPGKPCPYPEIRYGACAVPRFKDAPRYNMTHTGRTVGINASTKHPESALEFLTFLASPEYNEFVCRASIAKPPNKNYWKPELLYHPDYPEENPVHDMSIKAVENGRCVQRSPFIETSVASRILDNMLDVIATRDNVSDSELKSMAERATERINAIIARNVSRDKLLKKVYDKSIETHKKP